MVPVSTGAAAVRRRVGDHGAERGAGRRDLPERVGRRDDDPDLRADVGRHERVARHVAADRGPGRAAVGGALPLVGDRGGGVPGRADGEDLAAPRGAADHRRAGVGGRARGDRPTGGGRRDAGAVAVARGHLHAHERVQVGRARHVARARGAGDRRPRRAAVGRALPLVAVGAGGGRPRAGRRGQRLALLRRAGHRGRHRVARRDRPGRRRGERVVVAVGRARAVLGDEPVVVGRARAQAGQRGAGEHGRLARAGAGGRRLAVVRRRRAVLPVVRRVEAVRVDAAGQRGGHRARRLRVARGLRGRGRRRARRRPARRRSSPCRSGRRSPWRRCRCS